MADDQGDETDLMHKQKHLQARAPRQNIGLFRVFTRIPTYVLLKLGPVAAVTLVATIAYASDAYQIGQAAGRYLNAADLLVRFKQSKCGYIVRNRPITVAQRLREVLPYLSPSDGNALKKYINSQEYSEMAGENQVFIDEFLKGVMKDGIDLRTACGMLTGAVSATTKDAETAWKAVTQKP